MTRLDPVVLEVREFYEGWVFSNSGLPSSSEQAGAGSLSRLAGEIYQEFHSGSAFHLEHPGKSNMYDPEFSRRIIEATPAAERWVPSEILPEPVPGGYIVTLNGVRVRLDESRIRLKSTETTTTTAALKLPRLRPHLSPGYLYYSHAPNKVHRARWRVYVSVDSLDAAVNQWTAVLEAAQALTAGQYHAKVASTSVLYPRRDAIVVYFDDATGGALQAFADRVSAGTAAGTSRLAHTLAPGVSCAHEPRAVAPLDAGASFGQHRSTVLARLLKEGAGLSTAPFRELAYARFREANINSQFLHRNSEIVQQ